MRPKKIYINPKTLETLAANNEGVKTMSVRRFSSKTDAEYTDLSQVWHDAGETPEKDAWLLAELTDGGNKSFGVFMEEELPKVMEIWHIARWAYLSDFMPKGGGV